MERPGAGCFRDGWFAGTQREDSARLYLRSPLQSYQCPPFSLDMLRCVRRRLHSSTVVWKKRTGSFRTLHHSQLTSSDARRQTSMLSSSWPDDNVTDRCEADAARAQTRFLTRYRGLVPSVSSWMWSTEN